MNFQLTRRSPCKSIISCFAGKSHLTVLNVPAVSSLLSKRTVNRVTASLLCRVLEKIGMKQVGRNYYNPTMACNVQCGNINFEIWPGFVTSILQYERNVLLCAEISHKVKSLLKRLKLDCFAVGIKS